MLTFDDCLGLCGLSKGEIAAIAEHEHVPEIVAAEMAAYLCQNSAGERCIRRFILEDIAVAEKRHDAHHAESLRAVLVHFLATHPRALE
ncbi:hypothetical protein [Dongia sp.]|uniref:hypothetical protein n=1 Tax=Dongia sp. TaxID=1977262 RepID=UPI0035B36A2E